MSVNMHKIGALQNIWRGDRHLQLVIAHSCKKLPFDSQYMPCVIMHEAAMVDGQERNYGTPILTALGGTPRRTETSRGPDDQSVIYR